MVAEIKKYTFLVYHQDYNDLLKKLREAGVVHIVQKNELNECKTIQEDMILLKRYKKALRQVSFITPRVTPSGTVDGEPGQALADLESMFKRQEEAADHLELLKPEAEKINPWGDFNIKTVKKIREYGWNISLFVCSEKNFDRKWEEDYALEIISHDRGIIHFAIIHRYDTIPDIDANLEKIPERALGWINGEIARYENQVTETKAAIREKAAEYLALLNKGIEETISRVEFSGAAEQAEKYAEDKLYILEGWVPVSEEKKLDAALQDTGCYSFASEPDPDEKIPIILKNNRFTKLFEPISKLFSMPDYRELDLTPFFAPFFMMFFGFCLGDAGYGLFFIVAGFVVKRRVKQEFRPVISLAQYFGVAAILFGLLSGTFFGLNLIDSGYTMTGNSVVQMRNEGVPDKIIYSLNEIKDQKFRTKESFRREAVRRIGEDNYNEYSKMILKSTESDLPFVGSIRSHMFEPMNMFYLALLIGGMQIIFGMILKIINISRLKGFKYSLSTIGWVILAFTVVIFKGGSAVNLINEEKTRTLFNILLIISGILIFLFNSPHLNIFGRVGNGLWESYTILTGVFGDLLSYIRLFALGISSSILGFVFNQISLQMLSIPYVGWLFFLLLLLF